MTDTKTDAPAADPKADPKADPAGDAPTMADVRDLVREEVSGLLEPFKKLLPGASSPSGAPADAPASPGSNAPAAAVPDIGSMVDAAISKVLGDRDAKAKTDAHAKQHEDLAALAERKPVDRPKRSRVWGDIWDRD